MNVNFNYFNQPEPPKIILTKPTGEELFEIGVYKNLVINAKYNDVNIISFVVYNNENSDEGLDKEDYDLIVGKKYVTIEDQGIYIITNVVESLDGIQEKKTVTCKSVDFELTYKRISVSPLDEDGGVKLYELYNPITPEGTLIQLIIDKLPSWSIGSIDTELVGQFRYFDVDDITMLQLLYNEISNAYQCIFEPDYETRTINFTAISNVGQDSDIYLSMDNLIKVAEITEISDEIVSNLNVFGGNGLSINRVNPSGTNAITNLDYFKDTNFISQDLIDALDDYEVLYASKKSDYESLLLTYRTQNEELNQLQAEWVILNNELTALETLQKVKIQAGTSISDLYTQVQTKNSQIASKNNEINNKVNDINATINSLNFIVSDLSLENNFTTQEIEDLDKITIEYTYQNEYYIITDSMTEAEKQDQAQLLFDEAEDILARLAQPRFSFNLNTLNFLKNKEYEEFIEQFDLATKMYIEFKEDFIIETRLIEYTYDYDNNSLSPKYTNAYRVNDPEYAYTELVEKSIGAGISVSFNKFKTLTWDRDSKDEVTTFINSAINAAVNAIKSTEDVDMIIDSNGLRGRQSDGSGGYEDEQLWMTNNQLAFTDDDWQSAKVAIGKFVDPELGELWGIVAPYIVGRIIAGNQLIITNDNNSFVLNSTGATLTNASFTLTTDDNKGKIILDPEEGIRIQGNTTGSFIDALSLGSDGIIDLNGIRLNNGAFELDNLGNVTASSLTLVGTGNSGIDTFDDAGDLATQDDVNWNTQIENIPSTLGTPSGTGLFLSPTNLGFYDNGVWKTYMDNSGNFFLSGSGGFGGSLSWNSASSLLSIVGSISASSFIGGSVTGAVINNGSGTFSVDALGNMVATSGTFTGDITGATNINVTEDINIGNNIYVGTQTDNLNKGLFFGAGAYEARLSTDGSGNMDLFCWNDLDLQSLDRLNITSSNQMTLRSFDDMSIDVSDSLTIDATLGINFISNQVILPYLQTYLGSAVPNNYVMRAIDVDNGYLRKYSGRTYGVAEESGSSFTNLSIAATASGIVIRSGTTVLGSILFD